MKMTTKMGLRLKIIAYTLMVLVVLFVVSSISIEYRLQQEADQTDSASARQEMARLTLALDYELRSLDNILSGYAIWTELYEHAAIPNEQFWRNEFGDDAMLLAKFDWLTRFDITGSLVEHTELPQENGTRLAYSEYTRSANSVLFSKAVEFTRRTDHACRVAAISERVAIVCHRVLTRSDGTGEPRGKILIGRWLTTETLTDIGRRTNLDFTLQLIAAGEKIGGTPESFGSALSLGLDTIRYNAASIHVTLPVSGVMGTQIAEVSLTVPRSSAERMATWRRYVMGMVSVLFVAIAVGMFILIDQMVIRRLRGIESDVENILKHQSWGGTSRYKAQTRWRSLPCS